MLGSFPQVAQFYGQSPDMAYFDATGDEAAFVKSRPPLPSDLAQSYRPANPWPNSPTCSKDFVLVCEFSELEGPKPLITIPRDGGSSFDKNTYAVKIMAVDYNATNYARSSNTFKLSEDTSVIMEDKKEGAYSYIHHFTLYDIHARGFVRPFCMAYITADKTKLLTNIQHIMKCFQQVSQYFRYGNYVIFREEMVRRLADLIFTKENILKVDQQKREARMEHNAINGQGINNDINDADVDDEEEDDDDEASKLLTESVGDSVKKVEVISPEVQESMRRQEELESVEKAIREIEVILEAVNPALKKNKKMEIRFRRLKERYSDSEAKVKGKQPTPSNLHQEGYCSDDDRKPVKPRLRKRSSSQSILTDETDTGNDPTSPYQPRIVRAHHPRRFDRSLRTLHELSSWGAKEGLNRIRKLHKFFCRDSNVLHMEKHESTSVDPSVSLLTIGRIVTVNFLKGINLQCIANCQWDLPGLARVSSGLSETFSMDSFSSCQEDASPFGSLPPSYEARFVMGSAYASLESLYYEVEESMEDMFLDQEIQTPSAENGLLLEQQAFGSWVHISPFKTPSPTAQSHSSLDTNKTNPSLTHLQPHHHPTKVSSGEEDSPEDEFSVETLSSRAESSSKMSNKEGSSESLEKHGSLFSGEEPVLRRSSKVPVGCYASRLTSINSDLPGSGIKNFISHYVFAIHIIYALLSGRTVVIAASPFREREVNTLVKTLWLFVPGHSSRYNLVVPWHVKPLCMTDLGRMKLIGLAKPKSLSRVVPASVRRYITLFDYDQSTLWTPPYKGTFLDAIVSRNKHFQTDQCYIAYIQSVLLELASKAFLYYHSYCLNSPNSSKLSSTSSMDGMMRTGSPSARISSTSFLSKLGLTDGDSQIVEYWVELIKRQQIDELFRQRGLINMPSPSIRLDHRVCSRYQM